MSESRVYTYIPSATIAQHFRVDGSLAEEGRKIEKTAEHVFYATNY